MGKILFWFILILAVLLAGRLLGHAAAKRAARARQPAAQRPAQPGRGPAAPAAAQGSEEMVRCAHCGIHLPRSEALLQQGKTWCGSEHARLGVRPERTH
ncbi:PP0621 family protein [Corticimicrobacter populi]|uniref:MYND finger n=1 Tax=Corticimicrobacter populi TaxID=2175229 RepID=A0A2V1K5D8_9BURK|nr:PP0621 family protein [Corticimicrobacter populi]PWF24645.1 hypothetical protein DD235_00115 [Corticimicrobacter populi]